MGICTSRPKSLSRRKTKRNELPEDCWELILSRLPLEYGYRQLRSPSLVCKQFLSITDGLRRKLVIRHKVFFSNRCEVLRRALERFRNLEEIVFSLRIVECFSDPISVIVSSGLDLQALGFDCTPPSPEIFRILGSTMTNLKALRCHMLDSLPEPYLVAIADALPRLEELVISFSANIHNKFYAWRGGPYPQLPSIMVTDAGIEVISCKLMRLRVISICGNPGISDRSLIALSSNCVLLSEVRCESCNITEHGIYFVLCHSPNIISLRAEYRQSSQAFGDSKFCARALRVLDLSGCENADRLLCSIAREGIPLEKLKLGYDSGFSLHGLSTLCCACPSLKHLELAKIHSLNDQSMKDLCRYLPNVVSIKLLWCSTLSIATFFILAKACPALSEITLRASDPEIVQDDSVMDLESNHRITSLELDLGVSLNDEMLKKIGLVCPNLRTLTLPEFHGLWNRKEGIGEILKCCSELKHLKVSKYMEIHLKEFETRQIKIEYC